MPNLATLDLYPSWLNLKGGIDRSACIEIKLSEVRQLAGCVRLRHTPRGGAWRKTGETWPLPNETPAHRRFAGGVMRLAAGAFEVTAKMLHDLHAIRMPRRLAGDLRTARANVMRLEVATGPRSKPESKFRHRVTRAEPIAWPPDRNLSPNPNAGATRTKRIGLPVDWSQIIRIEKWHFPKRIQPAYFLVCPGHASNSRSTAQENVAIKPDRHASRASASSVLLPPLSTRPPGREDPSTRRCPQRCLKLMMVQCTEAEYRDAEIAQLWIHSIPPQLVPKYRAQINRLTQRYGLLFQPRSLLCPRCLKVKYGNNPETVRQGWRRRNNKPDTAIASNVAKGSGDPARGRAGSQVTGA